MMEAVAGFLAVFFVMGGFWFWITTAAWFGIIMLCAEHERNTIAFVSLALFVWGFFAFNTVDINWSLVPWLIVGYYIVGAAWSFVKWISYLHQRAERYGELKIQYAKNRAKATDSPDHQWGKIDESTDMKTLLSGGNWKDFVSYLRNMGFLSYSDDAKIVPTAKEKVNTIITWILWWPTSMLWTLLNDPLVRFAKWTVRRLNGWYDGISNKIFASVGASTNDNLDID
jgi:hypothetical protein